MAGVANLRVLFKHKCNAYTKRLNRKERKEKRRSVPACAPEGGS